MSILTGPYAYFLATRIRRRQIERNLKLRNDDLLLDAGCGIGFFCALFRGSSAAKVYGVDIDQEALVKAKSEGSGLFACADASAMPFKDSIFTGLILSEVLEHLPQEGPALKEIKRVCARSARIVITVPCGEGILKLDAFRRLGHDHPGAEFHFRDGYTKEGLRKLLSDYGFQVKEIYYCDGLLSELFIQLSKFIFLAKKKDFASQKDITMSGKIQIFFKIYKYTLFPVMNFISFLEDRLFCKLFRGYTLIARVENDK